MTKVCPQCGTRYEGEQRFCSLDGATLVAEEQGESLTGSVIADRYLVKEKLGEGGMGEVYLAEHVRIKRKVAIKVIRKNLGSDRDAILRFHREAENASQISHPNVAAVYDFGDTDWGGGKLVYLAMEYVAGKPLTAILEREPSLNHIRASDIVSQVSDALDAAHSLGIVHRDLKPDNVMVAETRVQTDLVKLLDFGIARVMDRQTQRFTSTGMIVGTPEWMSPEQISGDQIGAPADIYALGLIAFRMLTGEGAFGAGSPQDILLAKMTKAPRRLSEARPDVAWPPALQDAFDKVLAADPAQRYPAALRFSSDFYYAVMQLPMTPDAEAYLAALSRRAVTPTRGMGSIEATPVPGIMVTESGPRPAFVGGSPTGIPTPAKPTEAIPMPEIASTASTASIATPVTRRASEEITAPIAVDALIAASNAATAEIAPLATPAAGEAVTTEVAPPKSGARAKLLFYGGAAIAVVAVAGLAMWLAGKGGSGGPGQATPIAPNAAAAAPADSTPSTTQDSTTLAAMGPIITATAGKMPLDTVRARSENSVYRVIGSKGQGAGFLADSQGVVLTSASFLTQQDTVTVFLNGYTRVLGRVLAIDAAKGLAAVRIPMKQCQRCAALALAEDTTEAAQGDSVLVIGAPTLTARRPSSRGGIAARDDARGSLTTSLRVNDPVIGGPVLVANQIVVGVARQSGAGGNGVVTTLATAKDFLNKARTALATTPAIETILPTWPRRPVTNDALNQGRARTRDDIVRRFTMVGGDYGVFVMSPQVLAWRQVEAQRAKEASPMSIDADACLPNHTCDVIEEWPKWRDYLTERRAVVIVQVSPKVAQQPKFGNYRQKPDFRAGNVGAVSLTVDGVVVEPIEAARVHAVANPEEYPADKRFFSAIYVYSATSFAGTGRIELRVAQEGNPARTTSIVLKPEVIQAVSADVSPFVAR